MNNIRAVFLTLLALCVVSVICAGMVVLLVGTDQMTAWGRAAAARLSLLGREDEILSPLSSDTTQQRFIVDQGDTAAVIATKLVNARLIADDTLFVTYVRAERLDQRLEAGIFFLSPSQNLAEIAQELTDSRFSQITLTVIEGWRMEEIIEAIDANRLFGFSGADFRMVVGQGTPLPAALRERLDLPEGYALEGYLFPATYSLSPDVTPEGLRDQFIEAFFANVDDQVIADARSRGLSLFEVVTLASIVEREALHNDEKPRIAGVYLNRLNIDMKLDADPTVQYALQKSRGAWWPRITADDYTSVSSPYNTYLNTGLPPGPIANPGLASIRAVVYPQDHNYYYFRADCRSDGYHDFATSYEEHLANGC